MERARRAMVEEVVKNIGRFEPGTAEIVMDVIENFDNSELHRLAKVIFMVMHNNRKFCITDDFQSTMIHMVKGEQVDES